MFILVKFSSRNSQAESGGGLVDHSRKVLGLVGILLMAALTLSIAARHPCFHGSRPYAHASTAYAMTDAHADLVPWAQPARTFVLPAVYPTVKSSVHNRVAVLQPSSAILYYHALRSPPLS